MLNLSFKMRDIKRSEQVRLNFKNVPKTKMTMEKIRK
jgi:hypothetical protein